MSMRPKHNFKGLTLVELLVALMVTSIVLTAVATLAYALGRANDSSNDTAVKQAQVRYATLRISELIKYSKLVYADFESELLLWQTDKNNDGEVNVDELVYIDAGPDKDYIQLCDFESPPVVLIPQCRSVQFVLDSAAPDTKSVSILFELEENDVWHKYQISATVRCKAG